MKTRRAKKKGFAKAGLLKWILLSAVICSSITVTLYRINENAEMVVRSATPQWPYRCQDHLPELIRTLKSKPEEYAVRPTSVFPGLGPGTITSAFRGKRIALLGDSTLYYFTKWLHLLIDNPFPDLDEKNLSEAQADVLKLAQVKCAGGDESSNASCIEPLGHVRPSAVTDEHGTYIAWSGMSGFDDHLHTEYFLDEMWREVKLTSRPEIMVVNMGLHWLHFYNITRTTSIQAIRRWIHYEKWLQEVYDKAVEMKSVKILLYKTTNFVCETKLYGTYLEANDLYKSGDKATLKKCMEMIQEVDPSLDVGDIQNYCANGTINDVGSRYLNRRLHNFVRDDLRQPYEHKVYVGIFNDYDIQKCQHSQKTDGLHYHASNLMRVRLLANMILCAEATIGGPGVVPFLY